MAELHIDCKAFRIFYLSVIQYVDIEALMAIIVAKRSQMYVDYWLVVLTS